MAFSAVAEALRSDLPDVFQTVHIEERTTRQEMYLPGAEGSAPV